MVAPYLMKATDPMHFLTQQCTATSKKTGERCKRLVTGGGPCRMHGGAAGQVARRRDERVELAETIAATPRRHPAEVLLDTLHVADVMLRSAVQAGAATPEELAKLVETLERAQRFAKVTLDVDLVSRQQRVFEQVGQTFIALFDAALEAAELTAAQHEQVRRALVEGLQRMNLDGETP